MATYLLPCSCGRNLQVATGLAGRTVRCDCGTELEVPSIRGLEQLERTSTDKTESRWGSRQGVLFLGLLLLTLGLAAGIVFQLMRPKIDDYAAIRAEVERWPVEQQRVYWAYMQSYGIRLTTPEDAETLAKDIRFGNWSRIGFLVTGVGLLITVGALLLGHRKRSSRSATGRGLPAATSTKIDSRAEP